MKKGDIVVITDKNHKDFDCVFCIIKDLNENKEFGLHKNPQEWENLTFVKENQIELTDRFLPITRKISPNLDAYDWFGTPNIKPSNRSYGLLFE